MALSKKQKEVYDYIKDYSLAHGYSPTQNEIKEYFDLKSLGSVQRYIKYLVNAGLLVNEGNAHRGLKVIVSGPDGGLPQPSFPEPANTPPQLSIPLIGKVAAGNPTLAVEDYDDTVSIPTDMITSPSPHFALQVEGESMIEAGILPGDLVVCRQQRHADNGEIVVAIWEGEATVKKYYHQGDKIELRPCNSSMESFWPTSETFFLAAVVVGLLRRYH